MLACNSSSKLVTDMELGQGRGNKVITGQRRDPELERAGKEHRLKDPGLVCMNTPGRLHMATKEHPVPARKTIVTTKNCKKPIAKPVHLCYFKLKQSPCW